MEEAAAVVALPAQRLVAGVALALRGREVVLLAQLSELLALMAVPLAPRQAEPLKAIWAAEAGPGVPLRAALLVAVLQ